VASTGTEAPAGHISCGISLGGHPEAERKSVGRPLPGLKIEQPAQPSPVRLDAWHASNGTAVSRAISAAVTKETSAEETGEEAALRVGGTLTDIGLTPETILGTDDRVEVSNTQQNPYAWICDLLITDSTGTEWLGTGWLAHPRLVITAGHCVYLQQQGWAASLTVFPRRNGSEIPFTFEAAKLYSVDGWIQSASAECDYGGIILPPEASTSLGFFGYASYPDDQLSGEMVNVVGYPGDKQDGTLWGSVRTLSSVLPGTLLYQNDTYGGMSGSPVIRWDGNDYSVVGIHNYGDLTGNQATRITGPVFQNIGQWAQVASSS
jgi:glutamyl endopeptidase